MMRVFSPKEEYYACERLQNKIADIGILLKYRFLPESKRVYYRLWMIIL